MDQARELTLRFKDDVTSLELMDRKTAQWRPVALEKNAEAKIAKLTLAPGDGELLRVNRGRLLTARNLLSRPPHRKRSERGAASGSEGVWGSEGRKEDEVRW